MDLWRGIWLVKFQLVGLKMIYFYLCNDFHYDGIITIQEIVK